jgi:1,4-alpha-glucan branching enzyme
VLPISHDEVVHGKGSMLQQDAGQRGGTLRQPAGLLRFHVGAPGKEAVVHGLEFAQPGEWNHNAELDWARWTTAPCRGVQRLVRDLNTLYRGEPALHVSDTDPGGFQWIEADDAANSVYSWIRRGGPEDAERGGGVQLHARGAARLQGGAARRRPMARGAEHRCRRSMAARGAATSAS